MFRMMGANQTDKVPDLKRLTFQTGNRSVNKLINM